MKIAVFGCLHGMLNEMYRAVLDYERHTHAKVDFIIVCGDCQTIRHYDDLRCLAVPNRYKQIGDFHEYYSGKKKVPKLTIFVGGNHEASNYLMTLPYGGWVCDNFYYLGYAGVVNYRGLRIGGISGIYNARNCTRGRFERLPFDEQSLRSIYHTRRLDVFRLQLLSRNAIKDNPIDIFLSHDWPVRIYNHGDLEQLLRFKPNFKNDVESREGLGNPLIEPLVYQLKPRRWFAAHMHCRFYAKVKHDEPSEDSGTVGRCTEFLSLNKIEKGRRFVEFIDFSPTGKRASVEDRTSKEDGAEKEIMDNRQPLEVKEATKHSEVIESDTLKPSSCNDDNELYYDAEWLTILRKTIDLENSSWRTAPCPDIQDCQGYIPSHECMRQTIELMNQSGGMIIKRNFKMSEPVIYNRPDGSPPSQDKNRCENFPNPQHEDLCLRLQIKSQMHQSSNCASSPEIKFDADRCDLDKHIKSTYHHNQCITSNSQSQNFSHNQNQSESSYRKNSRGRRNHAAGGERNPRFVRGDLKTSSMTTLGQPVKKQAFELDEDGCLPFYVDRKGES